MVKNLPAMQEMQETQIWSLGREDPLGEGMATHSSIFAWRIQWMGESGGLESSGLQRAGPHWRCWAYSHPHTPSGPAHATGIEQWKGHQQGDARRTEVRRFHGNRQRGGDSVINYARGSALHHWPEIRWSTLQRMWPVENLEQENGEVSHCLFPCFK